MSTVVEEGVEGIYLSQRVLWFSPSAGTMHETGLFGGGTQEEYMLWAG